MKSQKGITLISTIMTVILVLIISGLAVTNGMETYRNSKVAKFQAYMKMLQKKVDIIIEEGTGYSNLGSDLTEEQKTKLRAIITNDGNQNISTTVDELNSIKLRYFSVSDIEEDFEIKDIQDEIVINFGKREVISLNGVEKDGVTHYVEHTTY